MIADPLALVHKYKNKGIVIDTNLAILYIVGSSNPRSIGGKRTSAYSTGDFDSLSKFIDAFETKIVTPNILTEISNLLGKEKGLRDTFAGFVARWDERFIPSKELARSPVFSELGLTDSAIIEIAKKDYLVLTDDAPLGLRLRSLGADAISLSHISHSLLERS